TGVVRALAEKGAVWLQGQELQLFDILVGSRQENQHQGRRSLEGGEPEILLHVGGAEETELNALAEGVPRFGEGLGEIAFVQYGYVGEPTDRFEAAQDVGLR